MTDILFAEAFAKELEAETTSTRKCLERIPESLFDYKPHEKSMNLGYLSLLVAEIPKWIKIMIEQGDIDFATFTHIKPANTKELVAHFDENIEGAKNALRNIKDGDLIVDFHLKNQGHILFTSTKKESVESTINHMVHHRGQLTVYMRLNNIPVPSIYGPSADDRSF
ncbi:MAG: DinB family protein [Agriterribacter sp.]